MKTSLLSWPALAIAVVLGVEQSAFTSDPQFGDTATNASAAGTSDSGGAREGPVGGVRGWERMFLGRPGSLGPGPDA